MTLLVKAGFFIEFSLIGFICCVYSNFILILDFIFFLNI